MLDILHMISKTDQKGNFFLRDYMQKNHANINEADGSARSQKDLKKRGKLKIYNQPLRSINYTKRPRDRIKERKASIDRAYKEGSNSPRWGIETGRAREGEESRGREEAHSGGGREKEGEVERERIGF